MSPASSRRPKAEWSVAFRALWVGQSVSSVGTQISLVAIPLIAVLTLHAGPMGMAILAALETAPFVLFSLPAGVIADRGDRRHLLIFCDVGRAIAMATIPIAFALGVGSFAWLCAVAAVVGALSALFTVAQQAYVPAIVGPDQLVKANQALEITDSGARVIGPGAAGAIFQVVGGFAAVTLDAVSYLVSAIAIGFVRPSGTPRPAHAVAREPVGEALRRGIEHVVRDPILRPFVISTAIFNLGSGMMLAQLALFATRNLGVDAAGYGLFYALGNVGFLIGALLVGRLEARLGTGGVMVLATTCGGTALLMIAAAGAVVGFPLLLAGRFVGALSAPIYNVVLVSARQARTPDQLRARVTATFRVIDWGTAPIGAVASGIIGATAGVPAVMGVAGVLGLLSIPWVLGANVRNLSIARLDAGVREAEEPLQAGVDVGPTQAPAGAA